MKKKCLENCEHMRLSWCTLYHTALEKELFEDPYDKGLQSSFVRCAKCSSCDEDVLICSIDNKIRDITSFYSAFKDEMDILLKDLDDLLVKQSEIQQ